MVCGRSSGLEQLQQVVGEAADLPFRCGFFPASHQEAPQSSPFLDLSKYRLHDRLAHLIDRLPRSRVQLVTHCFRRAFCHCLLAALNYLLALWLYRRWGLDTWDHRTGFVPYPAFLTFWWHQQLDAPHLGVGHRSFAEIARIRSRVLRLPSHVLCHLLQHRQQLLLVIGILRQRRCHDDLRMTVHRCLPVVSLHETFRRPVFHDAGFRIGEVPLRRRFWFGLLGIGHLWRAASKLLALRLFLSAPIFQLRFHHRLLDRGTFPCFLLQCRLGLGDLLQSALPPRQLCRQFIPSVSLAVLGVFGGVRLRCLGQ